LAERVSAEEALKLLIEGNWRFMNGIPMGPNRTPKRRRELLRGQRPFAAVLGCSDSRAVPELIFDTGLGDLFVVRLLGNIADEGALGSIEFAVENLGVRLVMVLGHTRCGAVGAVAQNVNYPGHIEHVLGAVRLGMENARADPGEGYNNCILANTYEAVKRVAGLSEHFSKMARTGELKVAGALYDLETGEVEFLEGDVGDGGSEAEGQDLPGEPF
jgi:carbonic anhydrase